MTDDKWFCDICEPKKEFENMEERNQHLINNHDVTEEALP